MSLGERMKKARSALDLSQRALADILDVRQATVSAWETGATEPTAGNLRLFADLFENDRLVYEWLRGEGGQPRLQAREEGQEEVGEAARTHGFDAPDLSRQIQQAEQLVNRAELSVEIAEELRESIPEEPEALGIARRAVDSAIESARSSHSALKLAREILEAFSETPSKAGRRLSESS